MQKFRTFEEARKKNPAKTKKIAIAAGAWRVSFTTHEGVVQHVPYGSEVVIRGFTGSARIGVVCAENGEPQYDKLLYMQNPGVAFVAWGLDPETGVPKIAYLTQERPFAKDPEQSGEHSGITFGQIPMGFLSRAERELPLREGLEAATRRESLEELGAEVLKVEIPNPVTCWMDPTFMRNGTFVAFAEVNLATRQRPGGDTSEHERIQKVEFLPISELLARINAGRTEDGAVHHMGLSLAPMMLFFAHHPELLAQAVS